MVFYVHDIRGQETILLDEITFRKLLLDSEVMVKDHGKWNWDAINELTKALLNPKHFDELVRTTKFVQKIITFLRPSSKYFSEISIDDSSPKIIKACTSLICNLASSTPGYRFLAETKIVQEIIERLKRLCDPMNFEIDIAFTKEKMDSMLSRGYFSILGGLQKLNDGERILEDNNAWTVFYSLIELRGRDDLAKNIIINGNYAIDGHMRIIFSKLLSSGYKEMRHFTTMYIKVLLDNDTAGLEEWLPQALIPQLFDPAPLVSDTALGLVKECCRQPSLLLAIIDCCPDIQHLGFFDCTILLDFLALPQGFLYLNPNFIEGEFKYWIEHGVYQYVDLAANFMDMKNVFEARNGLTVQDFPVHFFGALSKTKQGCLYLKSKDKLTALCEILKNHDTLQLNINNLKRLKASIWAVCNICSSNDGFDLIQSFWPGSSVLNSVMKLATDSNILTLRGY